VGAPCNICLGVDERYASIMRMNPDGSELEVYAHGVRNSVGFDWHPETGELWFTDNGRDWMGDDLPPCELNHAPQKGLHFGYPFCHGGFIPDPKFNERSCSEFTKPAQNLLPHCAPLGMMFYTGKQFPSKYKNQVFIAEHGSWNRTTKIGYQVSLVELNQHGEAISYTSFASGFEREGRVYGRPVDVLQMADGSILVSDDHADCIYRIYYQP
jgi:glucose/arabinose dehydrogenase